MGILALPFRPLDQYFENNPSICSLGPVINIIIYLLLLFSTMRTLIKITHQLNVSVAVIDFRRYFRPRNEKIKKRENDQAGTQAKIHMHCVSYWKRSLRTFSTVFTLNMKKIVPMIDCSLSITRFVT